MTTFGGRLHLVAEPKPGSGFVIVIPGGGYSRLSPSEALPVARWFADAGIPSGHLEYAVNPGRHPLPLLQTLEVIRDLRAGNYGTFDGPIVLCGFSAGGHLAGLAATATLEEQRMIADAHESLRPDLAILAYAVTSFDRRPMGGMAELLVGDNPSIQQLHDVSLHNRVDDQTPPFFIWHTGPDPSVPVDDALVLAQALYARAIPTALHVFPYGGHALNIVPNRPAAPLVARWKELCLEWLEVNGIHGN